MINRKQAIEVFESYGFSIKPLQFIAEEILIETASDGYVRYGLLTIEQKRTDALAQFKVNLLLKINIVNSFTNATDGVAFLFSVIEKTVLFDQWNLLEGDPGNQEMYFIGYKMKL